MKGKLSRTFWCCVPFTLEPPLLPLFCGIAFIVLMISCQGPTDSTLPEKLPRVLDDRLTLSLFAADPDIVTPIGIAVDSLERVYVLESHTHTPPKDYKGPDGDQIKVFTDENGDGKPEKITVYAGGFREGLHIAFCPEGTLYVVTSRGVYALYDRDGDGVSDERKLVVELTEPTKVYAHAALLGIAFSHDGWMYVSRGNTGSASWKMTGSDGSSISGYGDGGNIARARLDGSSLHEVATGFWNPVDLKFDVYGRLLAADNDPDSRGPNRLVHVVDGGDYGYKSLYGGSGIHPYSAWNGELPGTLPFAVALGEAPSGLVDATLTSFPEDYHHQMLATIWEESRIVRISLVPHGVSVKGSAETVVEGDAEFRPVAFAAGPGGDLYITDWVLRSYPNHGRGRIWKLTARHEAQSSRRRKLSDAPLRNTAQNRVDAIRDTRDTQTLINTLRAQDPFLRHTAIMNLSARRNHPAMEWALRDSDPAVRLGAMVAAQRGGYAPSRDVVRGLLGDPDSRIRMQALTWIGREGMKALQPDLSLALSAGPVSPSLFDTYLETVRHLDVSFMAAYRRRQEPYAKSIERPLPEGFLEDLIGDPAKPAELRALAVAQMADAGGQVGVLLSLAGNKHHPLLRFEAVQALARGSDPDIAPVLLSIAEDPAEPAGLRAEALLSLMWQPGDHTARIAGLLQNGEADIRIEAARYIRTKLPAAGAQKIFREAGLQSDDVKNDPLHEQVAMTFEGSRSQAGRPATPEQWQRTLSTGGNAARGRRVFYSPTSMCSACHAVQGKGGDLGPDLSNVSLSKTRSQLVNSILDPSAEITPEYQGWFIRLAGGAVYQGRQIDIGENDIELYTHTDGFRLFSKKEIADYGMITTSLMPEGLEKILTLSDLRDLLSFLEAHSAPTAHGLPSATIH